jgi:hypothetical protein
MIADNARNRIPKVPEIISKRKQTIELFCPPRNENLIVNKSDFTKFLSDDVFFRTTPGNANRHAHARRVLRANLDECTMSCFPISTSHVMLRMAGTDGHRWGERLIWNWEVPVYGAIQGFQEVNTPHRGRHRRPHEAPETPMQVYRAEGSQTGWFVKSLSFQRNTLFGLVGEFRLNYITMKFERP